MTPKQEAAIRAHGEALQRVFPATVGQDPIRLCKRLRRIEGRLSRHNTTACSREMTDAEIRDETNAQELAKSILWGEAATCWMDAPEGTARIKFNSDPRGYALKIHDSWMREHRPEGIHRDWGGYGIIAPEIGPEGVE